MRLAKIKTIEVNAARSCSARFNTAVPKSPISCPMQQIAPPVRNARMHWLKVLLFGALAFTVSRYFRCSSFSSGVSLRPCFTSFAISLFLLHCCRIDYERGQYRFCSGFPGHWFPVSCFHPLRTRRKYCVGHDVFFVKRNHYAPPRRQSLHR